MKKKIMAIFTAIVMIATMVIPASAADAAKLWTAGGFNIGKATFYFTAPTVIAMAKENVKYRLVYETDEQGNVKRDAEGKRIIKEQMTERQKLNPEGNPQIQRDKDGNPILDAQGNTIPVMEKVTGALFTFKPPVDNFTLNFAERGKAVCVEGDLWYSLFPKAKTFITGIDDGDVLRSINSVEFSGVQDPTDDKETLNPNIAADVGVNRITLELEAYGDAQYASLDKLIEGDPQQQNEIILTTDASLKDINANPTTTKGKIVGTFKSRTTKSSIDLKSKTVQSVVLDITLDQPIKGNHDLYLNFSVKVPQPEEARLPETKSSKGEYIYVSTPAMQKATTVSLPPKPTDKVTTPGLANWQYLAIGGGALVLVAGATIIVIASKKKKGTPAK